MNSVGSGRAASMAVPKLGAMYMQQGHAWSRNRPWCLNWLMQLCRRLSQSASALLQQYGSDDDAELALLLWQGEITQQAAVLKAVQRLRSLVAFLQSQGIADAARWLQWRDSADAQAVVHGAPHQAPETINALLWHLDSVRCDVPWVLMFAKRVLGQAPAHGHVMLAMQEMAEAMNLSAKALARRIAWHERLFQALGDVPEFRLAWWRCVKRTLQVQLTNATAVKLQVQGVKEPLPLSLAVHLRQGQPMLTIQLPRAFGAAPAWPNLTMVQLGQEGWGPGLGLRLLLQGEGALPAQLQLEIAKRWKAAQLQPPVFERISATKWEISCCWCDGLWKPSNLDQAEVSTWAIDTALQVMEYVLMHQGDASLESYGCNGVVALACIGFAQRPVTPRDNQLL